MKFLYGTSNPSKLQHMREMLQGLDVEIIGLSDLNIKLDVKETGASPLENARIKALAYYKISGIPTFSCDSGLYIKGLEDEKQPGVFVRRVGDRYLNDEDYIEYYANLAKACGGEVEAAFINAISLVFDEDHILGSDALDLADQFIMTSIPHPKRVEGFPMNSIAKDLKSKKYFVEEVPQENEENITKGFRDFFKKVLQK